MKKIMAFFLRKFDQSSLEIQKKSKILLSVSLFVIAVLVCDLIFDNLLITHDMVAALIDGAVVVLYLSCLFFLRKGNYPAASNLGVFILLAGMICFTIAAPALEPRYQLATTTAMFLVVLLYSCLVGYSTYQPVVVYVFSLAADIAYYWIMVLPKYQNKLFADGISTLVIDLIFLTAGVFIARFALANNRIIVKIAETESDKNRTKLEKIRDILTSSRSGLEIGSHLEKTAGNTIGLINHMESSMNRMLEQVSQLKQQIQQTLHLNNTITDSANTVKSDMTSQASSVNETSSSVEEINRSVGRIAENAKQRKLTIESLSRNMQDSRYNIDLAKQSIERLEKSSNEIMNVSQVILEIASQTKILSMNASIESAHAGASGKGFSIVASEIRKLAEDTNKNTKIIRDALSQNRLNMNYASEINSKNAQTFLQITKEVEEVTHFMDEIIMAIDEVSRGTASILTAVSEILSDSHKVDNAMHNVASLISEGSGNIVTADQFSTEMSRQMSEMKGVFDSIKKEMQALEKIGIENSSHIAGLNHQIEDGLT